MDCNTIGARIKSLRDRTGETQAALADALKVRRQTVDQWENGTRDLKTQYTISLADHFGVTCDEILRGIQADNVDIHRRLGMSDAAIESLEHFGRHPFKRSIINYVLTSETFAKFVDTLYERWEQELKITYKREHDIQLKLKVSRGELEEKPDNLIIVKAREKDEYYEPPMISVPLEDAKRIMFDKIREMGVQIMEGYIASIDWTIPQRVEEVVEDGQHN